MSRSHPRPDLVPNHPQAMRTRSLPSQNRNHENLANNKTAGTPKHKERHHEQRSKHSSRSGDRHGKQPAKPRDKQSKNKSTKLKENKPIAPQEGPLPDFIPIHHVNEPVYNQRNEHMVHMRNKQRIDSQYEYQARSGQAPVYDRRRSDGGYHHRIDSYRQAPSYRYDTHATSANIRTASYMDNRPRTGVGVMFNPAIGSTDF